MKKTITPEQALIRLANYCSCAERCIFDIRKRMYQWEISIKEQEKIIQKLQKENFVNEKRYCQAFVNSRTSHNHFQGFYKIKYELEQKQIPQKLIQQSLSQINPQETRQQLAKLLENKRKSLKGNTNYEINQKLIRFASQRGFSAEDIKAVLNHYKNTTLINNP